MPDAEGEFASDRHSASILFFISDRPSGNVFESLKATIQDLLSGRVAPGDRRAAISEMKRALVSAKRANHIPNLLLKLGVAPFPPPEVSHQTSKDPRSLSAVPHSAKQVAIEIKRNERANRNPAFLHQRLLFGERLLNFGVHPPAR